MSEFVFQCPSCQKDIQCDESLGGQSVQCPTCGGKSIAPNPKASKLSVAAHQPVQPHAAVPIVARPALKKKFKMPRWVPQVIVVLILLGGGYFVYSKPEWRAKVMGLFGKKQEEEVAAADTNTTAAAEAPPAPAVVEVPPTWTTNLSEASIPSRGVTGLVAGTNFMVDLVSLNNGVLDLRHGTNGIPDREIIVYLKLRPGESPAGKKFDITPDQRVGIPQVVKKWVHNPRFAPQQRPFGTGYAMKLELSPASAEGQITGKIYLALPDPEKSFVAGTFTVIPGQTTQETSAVPASQAPRQATDPRVQARYGIQ
jgi:hypothetical protein